MPSQGSIVPVSLISSGTKSAGHSNKLSPWHLDRYMREFCWRYNRRRMQTSIFEMALASMVSRSPLPYKTLVAF